MGSRTPSSRSSLAEPHPRPAVALHESHIALQVADYLRLRRAWFFRPHGHLGQLPGTPDFVGCWRGRFIAVEVKVPRPLNTPAQIAGFLGPKQRLQLWGIAEAGGLALVVTDVEQLRPAFEGASL